MNQDSHLTFLFSIVKTSYHKYSEAKIAMNMKFVLVHFFHEKINKFSDPKKLGFITFSIRIYKSHLLQHLNYQPFSKKCSLVGHCGQYTKYTTISNRAQTLL